MPSLSLALGASSDTGLFGHFWLGGTIERKRGTGMYIGAGVDIEIRDAPGADPSAKSAEAEAADGTRVEVWPVVRVGVSHTMKRDRIPLVRLYWLAGLMPNLDARHQLRLGAGLSLPPLIALAEIGIPSMLEVAVDSGTGGNRASIRAGWNF